jgi:hypothetical protein
LKKTLTAVIAIVSAIAMLGSVAVGAKPADSPDKAKNVAAKQCKDLKKADKAAFKALYGKHAMRSCIKGETEEVASEQKNAAKECKAERDADPAAFETAYGDKRNALGKCVSSKVKKELAADEAEFKNAAKECKAERKADPDAFKDEYGTKKGKNALGKCVSSKVKDSEEEPVEETPAV